MKDISLALLCTDLFFGIFQLIYPLHFDKLQLTDIRYRVFFFINGT